MKNDLKVYFIKKKQQKTPQKQDLPCTLLQKEVYVALPVTAPSAAGFLLTVFTEKPLHPVTSTSTT